MNGKKFEWDMLHNTDMFDIYKMLLNNKHGKSESYEKLINMVSRYTRDWEEEAEKEPTEAEIHAERSERFIKDKHIVCPFEGYEEEETVEVEDDDSMEYSGLCW